MYGLLTPALATGALPDDGVNLGWGLVDCPQPVAPTHAGVGKEPSLHQKLDGVCCGGSGQCQIPQSPH